MGSSTSSPSYTSLESSVVDDRMKQNIEKKQMKRCEKEIKLFEKVVKKMGFYARMAKGDGIGSTGEQSFYLMVANDHYISAKASWKSIVNKHGNKFPELLNSDKLTPFKEELSDFKKHYQSIPTTSLRDFVIQ